MEELEGLVAGMAIVEGTEVGEKEEVPSGERESRFGVPSASFSCCFRVVALKVVDAVVGV